MIRTEKLSKTIDGRVILDDVDLSVETGQALAVVGPNGSGKSVLLRALSLVDPPTSGTVQIGDRTFSFPWSDNTAIQPPWPALTVVFQQLFLWPHLTLRENVALPLRGRNSSSSKSADVEDLVELFQLHDVFERYPNQASLGQRQLVAIIRAVALAPRWLVLDEATSALDMEQTQRLLDLLRRLKEEKEVTLIIVSHMLGFAAALADTVLFIDRGQAVESGGPEILTEPRSERMKRFVGLLESITPRVHRPCASPETQ